MKNLLIPLLLLSNLTLEAQTKFDWGIGVSHNLHLFQHQNWEQFEQLLYKPNIAHSIGVNTYFDFNKDAPFQLRLNVNLGKKKIVFANKFRLPDTGARVKSALNHGILFADIAALSILNYNQKEHHRFAPIAGFFLSFNQYFDLYQSTRIGGGAEGIDENSTPDLNLEVTDYPFFIYAGINVGATYLFKLSGKTIKLYTIFNISPQKLSITYNANLEQLNGKFHYLTTGLNFSFRKKNKNEFIK